MSPAPPRQIFEERLREAWPVEHWRDVTILLAVSGGADSMALMRALQRLAVRNQHAQGTIEVAHFHHGWRPQDANADEAMVVSTCSKLNLDCQVGRGKTVTTNELDARTARYEFLFATARARGARYVVTAHTMDDQAETILHRILRGTALRGLAGIPSRRRVHEAITIVRPLLWASRDDVIGYLDDLRQDYREDATNKDCQFTRNRIRHELLPYLTREFNPEAAKSLLQLGQIAAETQGFLMSLVESRLVACVEHREESRVVLRTGPLRETALVLRRELFREIWSQQQWPQGAMSFEHWSRLAEQAESAGATTLPGGVHAHNDGSQLVLRCDATQADPEKP